MTKPARAEIADALRWALDTSVDPPMAAADWLARDIDPSRATAVALLTDPSVGLAALSQAKNAFKTMRIVGETSADRRLGARLYAAAIAAALVAHGRRISRQSETALARALRGLLDDDAMPGPLRDLAGKGLCQLAAVPPEACRAADGDDGAVPLAGAGPDRPARVAMEVVEIERVYLLDGLPALPGETEACRIEQGYLPDAPASAGSDGAIVTGRLRRTTADGGAVTCTHTIKRGAGVERREIERPITVEEFARHWPVTAGRRLVKTRYRVPATTASVHVVWEIDAFADLDLVLAEVELPSSKIAVELPAWLAPHVVREVSHEPAYRNYALALAAG